MQRFRHHQADTDSLLCFYAASLADVPVDALRKSLSSCSRIPPPAEASDTAPSEQSPSARRLLAVGSKQGTAGGSKEGTAGGALDAAAAQAWLERLQAWLVAPGLPLLHMDMTDVAGEADMVQAQLSRKASPYQV